MNLIPLINTNIEIPNLKLEYENSYKVGNLRLGKRALFFRSGFRTYYIPYTDIYRYYRRVKMIPARMCCGRMNLEIEYLVLCDKKKELAEIQLPNRLEALDIMDRLKQLMPNAKVGSKNKKIRYESM